MVTQIFGQCLFAPVGSGEACLYGYGRNKKSPDRGISNYYPTSRGFLRKLVFEI